MYNLLLPKRLSIRLMPGYLSFIRFYLYLPQDYKTLKPLLLPYLFSKNVLFFTGGEERLSIGAGHTLRVERGRRRQREGQSLEANLQIFFDADRRVVGFHGRNSYSWSLRQVSDSCTIILLSDQ